MSRHVAPAFPKPTKRHLLVVLGGLILTFVWASSIGAQEPPILRFEGRVTYVSPAEMLVALDSGGVVMLDLARIPRARAVRSRRTLRHRDRFHSAPEPSGHRHVHSTRQPLGSNNSIVGATEPLKLPATGTLSDNQLPLKPDVAVRRSGIGRWPSDRSDAIHALDGAAPAVTRRGDVADPSTVPSSAA